MKVKLSAIEPPTNTLVDLANQIITIKNTINKLGEQIILTVDHVNKTKAYITVLSYLFAKGVTAFRFDKMLLIKPNEVRSYVKTDKGYYVVHIREENEMMKVEGMRLENEKEYYQDLKDWLILLLETAPPTSKDKIKKEIEMIPA